VSTRAVVTGRSVAATSRSAFHRTLTAPVAALATVLGDPVLWVLGTAGFLVRGGLIVVSLPVISVPTPVEVTTILGAEAFTAAGLGDHVRLLIAVAFAVAAAAFILGAVLSSWSELLAFERVACDPEAIGERRGPTRRLSRLARLATVFDLAAVRALALFPAAAVLLLNTDAVGRVGMQEYLVPSDVHTPFVLRVAWGLREPLLVAGALAMVGDLIAAVVIRRVLAGRFRLADDGRPLGAVRRAIGAVVTGVLAWLATLVGLVLAGATVTVAWAAVRDQFLAGEAGPSLGAAVLVTLAFVVLWFAAVLSLGLTAAVRGALWDLRVLGRATDP
jgi:hypothetical protein